MTPKCIACEGRRYLICERSADGKRAVERCDECSWHGDDNPRTLHDEDAALLAKADGIACRDTYPCYVLGHGILEPGETGEFDPVDFAEGGDGKVFFS